jgi:DNA-binding transcriptional LysR family regulator
MTFRFHTRQATFRQLEIFKAVAENLSVSLAAKKMNLAQPTVSTQLSRLNNALGIQLFEKVGKKMYLTDEGEELLMASRELFDVIDRLEMRLAARAGLSMGHLKLGIVTTAKYLIPNVLGSFCSQYPEIEPVFQIGNRAEIINRLKDNLDDLYVFSYPPAELDIETTLLTDNPLVVIANKSHPKAKTKNLQWQDLSDERLLMREAGSGTRYAIEQFLNKSGHTPKSTMTIASNEAIKEGVVSGLGISILSSHALKHMETEQLTILNVKEFPLQTNWYVVKPSGKKSSPVAAAFEEHLYQELSANCISE